MATKTGQMLRGVYLVRDPEQTNKVVYVGSTSCSLTNLEHNHRNWFKKWGESGRTLFRTELLNEGKKWTFEWFEQPTMCELWDVEKLEGQVIGVFAPSLNIDKDPHGTSIKRGRYELNS